MTDRAAPDWLKRWEYAHRGLHRAGVPENSLQAARDANEAGLGIECDIQMSRDGVPMVFHDWELERLTAANGAVADLASEELEQLHLLGTDQTVPSLSTLFERVAGEVPLLIEIKSTPDFEIRAACAAVAGCLADYEGHHAVMSFDPRVGAWFAEHAPARVRGLVGTDSYKNGFESMWRDPDLLEKADPDFLAVDVRDLEQTAATKWRADGNPLLTWTVRTPEARARALAITDALISEGEGLA